MTKGPSTPPGGANNRRPWGGGVLAARMPNSALGARPSCPGDDGELNIKHREKNTSGGAPVIWLGG